MKKITLISPARICLFGDHQDYLGLPVIACAIDRYINFSGVPNKEHIFRIAMPDIGDTREIPVFNGLMEPHHDRDYLVSSLNVLHKHGYVLKEGFDITISGNIPINAGVSSSSALTVGWLRFLLETIKGEQQTEDSLLYGRLAYEAEVLEFKNPGGLMDQYTIAVGNVLYIHTGEQVAVKPISESLPGMILGESGVPKETLGVLGNLRGLAQEAISCVQNRVEGFEMIHARMEDYDRYSGYVPSHLKPYFYAAIRNYEITRQALEEFQKKTPDMKEIGLLMSAHHLILKDILKVTVPIIDDMVNAALDAGALGAKIVGSGGGGSIVTLAGEAHVDRIVKAVKKAGARDAYPVKVVPGVKMIY